MKLTAWRIVKAKHVATAFDGEGARRFGGRWNSVGVPMIYTAGSQSLAVLEMLVHLEAGDLLKHYRLIPVTFYRSMVESLDPTELPANWKRRPTPSAIRLMGDSWIASAKSVVLQVPSVVIPAERNFLFNPLHPDFSKIAIGKPETFRFDQRLKP